MGAIATANVCSAPNREITRVRRDPIGAGLARTAQYRRANVVDLLVAAGAEVNGLPAFHYDTDFDAIAKVTGRPSTWVVPAGSVS